MAGNRGGAGSALRRALASRPAAWRVRGSCRRVLRCRHADGERLLLRHRAGVRGHAAVALEHRHRRDGRNVTAPGTSSRPCCRSSRRPGVSSPGRSTDRRSSGSIRGRAGTIRSRRCSSGPQSSTLTIESSPARRACWMPDSSQRREQPTTTSRSRSPRSRRASISSRWRRRWARAPRGARCDSRSSSDLRQLAHPDIAEADRRAGVAVRLQLDRRGVVGLVLGLPM